MSKKFVEKNIKLSLEFDKYLTKNPRSFRKIPKGAWVIITVKGDKQFNDNSRSLIQRTRTNHKKVIEARKEGNRWKIQSFAVA